MLTWSFVKHNEDLFWDNILQCGCSSIDVEQIDFRDLRKKETQTSHKAEITFEKVYRKNIDINLSWNIMMVYCNPLGQKDNRRWQKETLMLFTWKSKCNDGSNEYNKTIQPYPYPIKLLACNHF